MPNRSYADCPHTSSHFSNASAITRILTISLSLPLIVAISCCGVTPSVSNPSAGESSSSRNCSYHDLRAHISYVCICCGCSHPKCGRGKGRGSTPKRKLRRVSPMTGETAGGRCQTCQKDEINHRSFGF